MLDQLCGSGRRAPRGQQVIYDQRSATGMQRILMDFQAVLTVLQSVGYLVHSGGQLPRFAYEDKNETELIGQGHTKDKPPGLDTYNAVWLVVTNLIGH